MEARDAGGHLVVGGKNYGQGSSREHAALAPRFVGLRAVIAKSFARIHWQNLVNFGIVPLTFADPSGYDSVDQGDELRIDDVDGQLRSGGEVTVQNVTNGTSFSTRHTMSPRQLDLVFAGGLVSWHRERLAQQEKE